MLTAKDLLYKAFDYGGLWNNSRKMKASQPSIARKAQLDVLFAAFGIDKKNASAATQFPVETAENETVIMIYSTSTNPKSMNRLEYIKSLTNFEYFSSGEFLADRDRTKYEAAISQITALTQSLVPVSTNETKKHPFNLVELFYNLYNFRLSARHMYDISDHYEVIDELSPERAYIYLQRKKFIDSLNLHFTEVDEMLCLLIDPGKRSFDAAAINYPNYDLAAMDAAWKKEFIAQRSTNQNPPL